VDVALEDGKAVDLAAEVRLDGAPPRAARINHPADAGPISVLVERAGLAPVLWLTDARGFTVDRVLVPAASPRGLATRVRLGAGDVEVAVEPVPVGDRFPERPALGAARVPLRVFVRGEKAFDGAVRPGEPVTAGADVLRVQEIRYWAGFRVVRERGGGLLVAGFVLSVAGIVWRMVLFRREVAVASGPGGTRVGGRGEFYPARFREELELVADLLAARGPGPARSARA
jgi:hypothetical protein